MSVLLICALLAWALFTANLGWNAENYSYGRKDSNDDLGKHIGKIHWLTQYKSRDNYSRQIITALISAGLICAVVYREIKATKLLITTAVCLFVLIMAENFYYYHADRYPMFYIREHTEKISEITTQTPKAPLLQSKDFFECKRLNIEKALNKCG